MSMYADIVFILTEYLKKIIHICQISCTKAVQEKWKTFRKVATTSPFEFSRTLFSNLKFLEKTVDFKIIWFLLKSLLN